MAYSAQVQVQRGEAELDQYWKSFCYYTFTFSTLRFIFGTETVMYHVNRQGMEVGIWDGMNLTVLLTLLIFNI